MRSRLLLDLALALVVLGSFATGLAACAPADAIDPASEVASSVDAIVDGTLDNDHPAVYFLYRADGAACTGALISPHVVLTARHCIVGG